MSEDITTNLLRSSTPFIHRTRLTNEFEKEISRRKLILVIAPPGYGKSIFLTDAADTVDIPVCSLSMRGTEGRMEEMDGRIRRQLIRRFRRLKAPLGQASQDNSSNGERRAGYIGKVLAEHVPEDHLLIVDDVGVLEELAPAVNYLEGLIRSLPAQTTLVLAGRSLPAIRLASLLAADQIKHYGAEELALDSVELADVVESRLGQRVNENVIRSLHEQTEGWVTGVVLSDWVQPAAISKGAKGLLVEEYFNENAFREFSGELQEFLVGCSQFPVINSDLCDQTLGRKDSQQAIDTLLRSGSYLFREGLYPEPFFRFQKQYRQFLLSKQKLPREKRQQVIQAAARWYETHELPEFAFGMSIKIGDYQLASRIASTWAGPIYVRGGKTRVKYWAEKLDEADFYSAELLRVVALCKAYGDGAIDDAWKLLDQATNIAAQEVDYDTQFRILASRYEIAIFFGIEVDFSGLLQQMELLADKVSERNQGRYYELLVEYIMDYEKDLDRARQQFVKVEEKAGPTTLVKGLLTVGVSFGISGRLEESYEVFTRARDISARNSHRHNKYMIFGNLGTTAHYLGKYFEAFSLYRASIEHEIKSQDSASSIWGLVGLGELLTDLGYFDEAEAHLRDGIQSLRAKQLLSNSSLLKVFLAKCLRKRGKVQDAKAYIENVHFHKHEWRFNYLKLIEEASHLSTIDATKAINVLHEGIDTLYPNLIGIVCAKIELIRIMLLEEHNVEGILQELLTEINNFNLHHFLVVEAYNSPSLQKALERLNNLEARNAIKRIEEFNRVRRRFGFILPWDSSSGRSFRALGGLKLNDIKKDDVHLRPVHSEVLFYLLEKEVASKAVLMETIWPGLSGKKQASNLHSAIYQIRKMLGSDIVSSSGGSYHINAFDLENYDARAFRYAAEQALMTLKSSRSSLGSFEEAITLYGGEFLPGFYSDWIIKKRRQLRSDYVELLKIYSSLAIRQNSPELAKMRLRYEVQESIPDEGLMEAYLRVLYEIGDYQGVTIHFNRYKKKLAEELQLEPAKGLKDLVLKAITEQRMREVHHTK